MKSNIILWMRERIKAESKHIVLLLLDIAVVVMCVVVIGSAWRTGSEFYRIYDQSYDADSLYYRTQDEYYSLLAEMTWSNRIYGRGERADSQEYYAIADYYDAAVQYYVCQKVGGYRWRGEMAGKDEGCREQNGRI